MKVQLQGMGTSLGCTVALQVDGSQLEAILSRDLLWKELCGWKGDDCYAVFCAGSTAMRRHFVAARRREVGAGANRVRFSD